MPITAAPLAPPKTARARTSSTASSRVTVNVAPISGKTRERSDGLLGWFQVGAIACIAKGWHADAGAISLHAEKLSEETAKIGDNVELIGKGLDILSMTGPYAALMGVALPFVAQIMMNHHVIPESVALEGVVPPAMLEAQVKADLAEIQMAAMMAQKDSERKLAELKAAMNGESG